MSQTHKLSLSFLPQRQKCFQSQTGRGPGTGHQLCDHGNSAAAVRSPHPTRHMCRHHWRSGSDTQTHIYIHMDKCTHTPHMFNMHKDKTTI